MNVPNLQPQTPPSNWIERLRGPLLPVARALGLTVSERWGSVSIHGCPACGATERHPSREDKRGAIGLRPEGTGWRCFQCDASGDAIDLVAYVIAGRRCRELDLAQLAEVREWCEDYLGRPPTEPTAAPAPPPRTYPPEADVRAAWESCVRPDDDEQVRDCLRGRGVDPVRVADLDLARALPIDAALPHWATMNGVTWLESGHRLLVPLYDAAGTMRSINARSIAPDALVKSIAPAGFRRAGLVMACPLARLLLVTGERPDWMPPDYKLRIVVAEGEIDYLAWSDQWSDAAELAPATLGIVSGSWTPEIAARIPRDSIVIIATDADVQGDKYAARIAETLPDVECQRWRPVQPVKAP